MLNENVVVEAENDQVANEHAVANEPVSVEKSIVQSMPRSPQDMLALRINQKNYNLHDQVEQIVLELIGNSKFVELTEAVYPEQAVEGSLQADDHEAARMIRQYAKENSFSVVAQQKLHTLIRSLKVVLRRYKLTRGQRISNI